MDIKNINYYKYANKFDGFVIKVTGRIIKLIGFVLSKGIF
jgi:hypothetical protein